VIKRLFNDRYSHELFVLKDHINPKKEANRYMSNKGKYKILSGKHADSNKQVILDTWDIQEQKLKTNHLGLPDFLNRHFTIKKNTGDNNENSEANAR
jgi:hypothetical protein